MSLPYYMGVSAGLYMAWVSCTAAGAFLGPRIGDLEQYGFDQGLVKPGYNPMSMMPWTARQLLWNPEPMGSTYGRICLEAFGRQAIRLVQQACKIGA